MSVSSLEHAAIAADALSQLAEPHDLAASIPARIAEVEEKYVSAIQGLGFPLPEIARGEGTGALAPPSPSQSPASDPAPAAEEEVPAPPPPAPPAPPPPPAVPAQAEPDAGATSAAPAEPRPAEAPSGGRPLAAGTRQMLEVVERAGEAGATAADVAAVLNVMQGDVTTKLTALSYAARPRVVRKPNTNPVVWVCTRPLDDARAAVQHAALQAAGVEE